MAASKTTKITYWITTGLIFLWEGLMPALTGHSKMAKDGILNLGYPEYFITLLVVFKVLGSVAIILPMVPARVKEWAYAGLTFSLISAIVSNAVVMGFAVSLIPLSVLVILIISYITYHKIKENK